jgi:hypothetical protein
VFTEPLDVLLTALENKVEREWPARYKHVLGSWELVWVTLQTANITYQSIRYLSVDKTRDPYRKAEYVISSPPLIRTILDNLFTLLFVFEDLPSRCDWYFKSDWREWRRELNRNQAEPELDEYAEEWIGRFQAFSDAGIPLHNISPSEVENPDSMQSWPPPASMATWKYKPSSGEPHPRPFLQYLHDWFYIDLSQQSHLSGGGLAKRAGVLLHGKNDPTRDSAFAKCRAMLFGQTFALTLALASEIEVYFSFGLREKVKYLWTLGNSTFGITRELYKNRYADLLGGSEDIKSSKKY